MVPYIVLVEMHYPFFKKGVVTKMLLFVPIRGTYTGGGLEGQLPSSKEGQRGQEVP